MNEQTTYSDYDILMDAVETLGNLRLPVNQINEIGAPIARVVGNLTALMEAIQRNREQRQAENTPEMIEEPMEVQEIPGGAEQMKIHEVPRDAETGRGTMAAERVYDGNGRKEQDGMADEDDVEIMDVGGAVAR